MTRCGYMDDKSQCSRKLWFGHYYRWLLLQVVLSHTPPLQLQEVHINGITRITIHITEYKIDITYLRNHDSTLMLPSIIFTCHPFQTSSISLLRVGNNFSVSSLFDVTKLQEIVLMSHRLAALHSQCQWTRIFISITTPMAMGTQLGFKQHWESYSS